MSHETIDWDGIIGADDFSSKVLGPTIEEIITEAVDFIGDEGDISTNAGQLKWLAEQSIEQPPDEDQPGYTVFLDLPKLKETDRTERKKE